LFLVADTLQIALIWAAYVLLALIAVWLVVWLWRRYQAQQSNRRLGDMLEQQANTARSSDPDKQADIDVLRTRLVEAVKTIKTSKLGRCQAVPRLYELPWYIVIGNPAAGKSSAVLNSGLQFPFADKSDAVIQGIGGTRNCDWFFTTEGILLDTAGRYSVHQEDRSEWLGFSVCSSAIAPKPRSTALSSQPALPS